jgi:hypothetical protein
MILDLDSQNTGTIDYASFAEFIHSKMSAREEINNV